MVAFAIVVVLGLELDGLEVLLDQRGTMTVTEQCPLVCGVLLKAEPFDSEFELSVGADAVFVHFLDHILISLEA